MATVDSDRLLTHIRILYSLISCLFLTVITTSTIAVYVYQNSRCYDARLSAVDERFADNVDRLSVLFANDSASNWLVSGGIRAKREVYADEHRQHRHHHHHKSRKSRRQLDDDRDNEESATPWPWVPVTSRISAEEMMKFCRSHCQNGDPGPMGPPGPKGNKGDMGYPGPRGEKGNIGFTGAPGGRGGEGLQGFQGSPGIKGDRGNNGLDGRAGLPGTPGLDGIPGRPGINGQPGAAGRNGTDGNDGKPGTPGSPGKPGPQGPPGPTGLHGPRGKKGVDGIPGEAGVNVWTDTANNTYLLAPKFSDGPWNKSISIREGEHLRLTCVAVGKPEPIITWQMENGKPIPTGTWNENSLQGHQLNFTHVNRRQSGVFECTAANGLSDAIRKYITINVLFPPTIKVYEEHVAPINSTFIVLSCTVEMFPSPIKYWLHPGGRIIDSSSRYWSSEAIINHYRVKMMLNITRINKDDYGEYKCYAKNDLGSRHGVVYLHRSDDPHYLKLTTETVTSTPVIHGDPTPPIIPHEELCPVKPCPECQKPIDPDIICIGGKRVIVRNVPFNESVIGSRDTKPISCMMMEIGKALYHRDMHRQDMTFGAWMKDAVINDEAAAKRVWLIRQDNPRILYEYVDEKAYHDDKVRREIPLKWPFVGNTHLVYNGSFYYTTTRGADNPLRSTTTQIARLDLSKNESDVASYKTISLLNADTNPDHYIYSTNHSYVDIAADENGVWFIHGQQGSPFTVVRKVVPETLQTERGWNLTLNHRDVGEMFIICGVLYVVKNVTSRTTLIQVAYNLFGDYMLDLPKLDFTNPFRGTTMISYNSRNKELLSWDKGSQLSYPILLRTIDRDADVLHLPSILDKK